MADFAHVKGLSELQKLLDTLPAKIEANIMRGALRSGMKEVLAEAQRNVASDTGELRDGLKIGTKTKGGRVSASIKAKGRHGYIAPWIEFGTQPHFIPGPLKIGDNWVANADHPGISPRPFMRPALDSMAQSAVIAAAEYIKKRLTKKEGLDTSYIMIEGDE